MMNKGITVTILLIVSLAVLMLIGLAGDALGAWDVYRAQAQARAAEARARELEAQAVIIRERQTMFQTVILSLASVSDTLLVTISYLVGGVLVIVLAVLVAVLLLERGRYV